MKKVLSLLTIILVFVTASAQELVLTPTAAKNAPPEATKYLTSQKLKPKKAKWSVSTNGVYFADFQKKKISKMAYYFSHEGKMLYKRTPIQETELPKELLDAVGGRMKGPGTLLYLFEDGQSKIYGVSVPVGTDTYVTKYFTSEGRIYQMRFK